MRLLFIISVLLLTLCPQIFGAVKQEELDEREARLTAHLQSFATWVDDACDLTQEQQDQLNERIKQAITKSQQAYQFPDFPNQIKTEQSRLYDYSPIRFVGIRGAAWGVFQAGLNDELQKILNKDQKEKYRAAMENRKQLLHDSFLHHVINTADRELFLTDQQKDAIKNLFPAQLPLLDNGLYSFTPHTGSLNEKPINALLSRSPLALNKIQKRLQENHQNNQQATLINAANEDDMQKKISVEVKKQMLKMEPALELRIVYFSRQFQLSEKNLQYLKLAKKGTMVKLANRWKEKAIFQQKKNAIRDNQNNRRTTYRILLPSIHINDFDNHPLWEHAVRKVITDSAYEKRSQYAQQATTGNLIALLDQELWLSSKQRNEIATMYHDVSIFDRNGYCQASRHRNSYDLCLLAAVLTSKRQSNLNRILNDSQLKALVQLKKQFQNNKNILTINIRRGRLLLGYMKSDQENTIHFFTGGGFIGGGGGGFF